MGLRLHHASATIGTTRGLKVLSFNKALKRRTTAKWNLRGIFCSGGSRVGEAQGRWIKGSGARNPAPFAAHTAAFPTDDWS
jgi:hypothetical protein